ncbi:MAG: S1/P1 nuclease, partial [Flavobacteriaceae bacterium]|nr:S1/P1 nuclease [Flavobacteriaceae bacterium]
MKKLLVSIIVFFLFIGTQNSFAHKPTWGATGHRAVGAIAQEYLTKTAEKKINKLLKGESLALVSTFGDDIKSDKRFKHLDPWHYINMPFDVKYEQSEKNPEGDIYKAIITCIDILKNKNSSEDDQ